MYEPETEGPGQSPRGYQYTGHSFAAGLVDTLYRHVDTVYDARTGMWVWCFMLVLICGYGVRCAGADIMMGMVLPGTWTNLTDLSDPNTPRPVTPPQMKCIPYR